MMWAIWIFTFISVLLFYCFSWFIYGNRIRKDRFCFCIMYWNSWLFLGFAVLFWLILAFYGTGRTCFYILRLTALGWHGFLLSFLFKELYHRDTQRLHRVAQSLKNSVNLCETFVHLCGKACLKKANCLKIAPIAVEILLFFSFKKIKDWNEKRDNMPEKKPIVLLLQP